MPPPSRSLPVMRKDPTGLDVAFFLTNRVTRNPSDLGKARITPRPQSLAELHRILRVRYRKYTKYGYTITYKYYTGVTVQAFGKDRPIRKMKRVVSESDFAGVGNSVSVYCNPAAR
jgi:hypothetical protein